MIAGLRYTVLIPARLASSRLPNKPLADLAGLPMIVRVAQRAMTISAPSAGPRVVVAGDSPSIVAACERYGIEAILTRTDHLSGSDRLAEACAVLQLPDDEIVVNVQGDEPLLDPALAGAVAQLLHSRPQASISTAAHPIAAKAEFNSPNVVKVVLDSEHWAMYFSRAPIPMARDMADAARWPGAGTQESDRSRGALRHIGIYAYRCKFLRHFPALAPAPIEQLEALEQLRAMWHGYRIAVHVTADTPGPGVDTPEDLERVRRHFAA